MKLSVNIITYNGATAFIDKAIESVLPYAYEILIYDTGSTDNTLEVLSKYSVKAFQKNIQHLGTVWTNSLLDIELTKILNELKDKSTGDWILKIDDDEIFPKELMEEIMNINEDSPIYSIIFTNNEIPIAPIKRLFKNISEIKWEGIYGKETLVINGKRISSNKCPILKNYFIHLGPLRKNINDRRHIY